MRDTIRRLRSKLWPWRHSKDLEANLSFETELTIEHRRPGFSGLVTKLIDRHKRGGKSGRPASEVLRIDRSDPNVTVKTHHVEEQAPDGTWTCEHDERVESPAKHR
jgi:hypothetical protein